MFVKNQFRGQVGVGLMVFQQLGGVNGILFYASEVFISAGKEQCQLIALDHLQLFVIRREMFTTDHNGALH